MVKPAGLFWLFKNQGWTEGHETLPFQKWCFLLDDDKPYKRWWLDFQPNWFVHGNKSQAVVRDAVLEGIQTWCLGLKLSRDVGNFFPTKHVFFFFGG